MGSHRINGVSALHTELMRQTTFRQLHELYADRIVNKTNGITFRRWLMQANPGFTSSCARSAGLPCWMIRPRSFGSPTTLMTRHCKSASGPSSAPTRWR